MPLIGDKGIDERALQSESVQWNITAVVKSDEAADLADGMNEGGFLGGLTIHNQSYHHIIFNGSTVRLRGKKSGVALHCTFRHLPGTTKNHTFRLV